MLLLKTPLSEAIAVRAWSTFESTALWTQAALAAFTAT